ncbi:hypothetical protein LMG28727_01740 [Paraburkholderia kirstenboschensis]|nr:hypothetical protein LMG28727_01740 [Paraburkholderia kirstenboschensis]
MAAARSRNSWSSVPPACSATSEKSSTSLKVGAVTDASSCCRGTTTSKGSSAKCQESRLSGATTADEIPTSARPSTHARSTSLLICSMRAISTSGYSALKVVSSSGRNPTMAEAFAYSRTVPETWPANECTSPTNDCNWSFSARAREKTWAPASVSSTPDGERVSKSAPREVSRSAMRRLIADDDMWPRAAARAIEPSSTTAIKSSRLYGSMRTDIVPSRMATTAGGGWSRGIVELAIIRPSCGRASKPAVQRLLRSHVISVFVCSPVE